MEAMTNEEVREFVMKNEWATGLKIPPDANELYYKNLDASCMVLKFPETPLSVPYFTRVVSMLGIDREELFYGALLWLRLWDIGSPQQEKTGWKIVEKMRLAFGETRPIGMSPAHSFRSDEFVELNAFLLPCFIFGWDAYLLPSGGDYFVHISHDEVWTVVTKSKLLYENLFEKLKDLNPEPAQARWFAKFCPGAIENRA